MPAYQRYRYDATAGRPPLKRRAVVGIAHDDVVALQTRLGDATTQLSAAVDGCANLDAATKAAWYDVAKRSVAFSSANVPILGDVSALYNTGLGLQTELAGWPARLKAAGCSNVPVGPAPAPAPAPQPSGGGFSFGNFLGELPPVALIIGLVLLARQFK
jgi:hypothetical protein